MSLQPEFRLLVDLETEVARWRRRTYFLLAVFLQIALGLIVMYTPGLFTRLIGVTAVEVQPKEERHQQQTMLYFPPDLLRSLKKPPPTNTLSDKNRRAQGESPKVDDKGLHMPYMRGNTRLPEIAGGHRPPAPPPKPPAEKAAPGETAQAPKPAPPAPRKELPEEAQLHLSTVKPSDANGTPRIRIPSDTAGQAIQQSLQAAIQNPGSPGPVGPGDSTDQFQNVQPNFSTSGPIILSDTRGVNFGPYLARVVYIVRRNWYAVIPESARLGEKGRVALVFEIVKDGSVPQLRLLASSGSQALDQAALASIRASNPFPPLPQQFTGNHLVLEFIYFYNLGTNY
ncbi:MAG: TonB C-terminal domain-containing protein [Acidobacteria bacterium]|nr:MAG: TonB C-terminal domain-containing protein [Acidobacteriota bacterium]